MNDERKGGVALIAGTTLLIVTMAVHPTGHDLFVPGRFARAALIGVFAHALAIASLPLSFLGALALSRRLAGPDRLAISGLVVYAMALVAGLIAAVVSGFVAPAIAREMIDAPPAASDAWQALFHTNGAVNQAFARVLVVGSSAAILLWSCAILAGRVFGRGIAIYGLVMGAAIVLALMSGHLSLDVHGFGMVVLAQAVWFITIGARMTRARAE